MSGTRERIARYIEFSVRHANGGEARVCKCCKTHKPLHTFDESPNSDDGMFPYCRSCVARMEYLHERKYQYYYGVV